ncbi:NB-ARC domain-containing protein [Lentzea sp. NPDC004789]
MTSEPPPTEILLSDLLATQQTQPIRPPTATPRLLPFEELSPYVFERLVAEVVLKVEGLDDVRVHGRSGQNQGGIDLVGWLDDETRVYQVRRIKKLTAAKLVRAVRDYAGPVRTSSNRKEWTKRRFNADRFVLATGCEVDDTAVDEALGQIKEDYKGDLRIELYDAFRLSRMLRDYPRIVAGIFGADWAKVYCGDGLAALSAAPEVVRPRITLVPQYGHEVVNRPDLLVPLVGELCREAEEAQAAVDCIDQEDDEEDDDHLVSVSGLQGAGGFGKTTLAKQIGRDTRIKRSFPDGVLWITIGEHVGGAELASRINDLALQVTGERRDFVDPYQAGAHLGRVLSGGCWLLVVDDVWHYEQLTPFLHGARRCVRLVTTRKAHALPTWANVIRVPPMRTAQSRNVLMGGLPNSTVGVSSLLRVADGWPILLNLMNRCIKRYMRHGMSMDASVERMKASLALHGPASFDINGVRQREAAVSATVEVSLLELAENSPVALDCYLALAIFPEDLDVSLEVLQGYWDRIQGVRVDALALCMDFDDLSLVQSFDATSQTVRLHDIIRLYIRHRDGVDIAGLNRDFLDSCRPVLRDVDKESGVAPWWTQERCGKYLQHQLGFHLAEAGLWDELDAVTQHEQWLLTIMSRWSAAVAISHLEYSTSVESANLKRIIDEASTALADLPDVKMIAPTLLSYLENADSAMKQVSRLKTLLDGVPYLGFASHVVNSSEFESIGPDSLPAAGTVYERDFVVGKIQALPAMYGRIQSISPAGRSFVCMTDRGMVCIFDPRTGGVQILSSRANWLSSYCIAGVEPLVVTGGYDGCVTVWRNGVPVARWKAHRHGVSTIAATHDGCRIFSASVDGSVTAWSAAGERMCSIQDANWLPVRRMIVSPDDSWIAMSGPNRAFNVSMADGSDSFDALSAGAVKLLTVDQTGNRAFLALDGGQMVYFDLISRTLRSIGGSGASVSVMKFSPDGRYVAALDTRRHICIWDSHVLKRVAGIGIARPFYSLDWVSDSSALLISSDTMGLRRFELRNFD